MSRPSLSRKIFRGPRIWVAECGAQDDVLHGGLRPASVHVHDGVIVAIAEYEEVPLDATVVELSKSLLMPALHAELSEDVWPLAESKKDEALRGGFVSLAVKAKDDRSGLRVNELADWLPRFWTHERDRDVRIEPFLRKLGEADLGPRLLRPGLQVGEPAQMIRWMPEWPNPAVGGFGVIQETTGALALAKTRAGGSR